MAALEPQEDIHLDQVAGIAYHLIDAYNVIVDCDEPRPRWEELHESDQQQMIDAVVAIGFGDASPATAHQAWCAQMEEQGWSWGEHLDREGLLHPNLVPFERLPRPAKKMAEAVHTVVGVLLYNPPEDEHGAVNQQAD